MAGVVETQAQISAQTLDRAVAELVRELAPEGGHLERAVVAKQVAAAAERRSRVLVTAANADGASWTDVGEAFGTSRKAAWERYSDGPDGGHSRSTHRRHSKKAAP